MICSGDEEKGWVIDNQQAVQLLEKGQYGVLSTVKTDMLGAAKLCLS